MGNTILPDGDSTTRSLRVETPEGGAEVEYEIVTSGKPVRGSEAESSDEIVQNNDGTYTITGVAENGYADNFEFEGDVLDVTLSGGEATVLLDGNAIDPTQYDGCDLSVDITYPDGTTDGACMDLSSGSMALPDEEFVSFFDTDRLAGVESDVESLKRDLTSAETKIGSLRDTMDSVNSTMDAHDSELETLTGDLTAAEDKITALNSDLTTVQNDVTSVRDTLGTVQSDASANSDRIGTLESNLSDLNTRLSSLDEELSGLQSTVSALEESGTSTDLVDRVDALESRLGTLEDDYEKTQSRVGRIVKWMQNFFPF